MPEPDLLLDTDVLIEVLRGRPSAAAWLTGESGQVIGVPVLVRMEILQGARNKQEQQALVNELSRYWVAHLESGDTLQALSWFETFHLSHGVGIFDCLIAAVAVRLGKTLYSFNLKHYQVIPNLDVRQPYEI